MAGAVCVGTATATVVACGNGSTSQAAKQVQKPASVASTSTPVVKLADATPAVVVQSQPAVQRYVVAPGDTLWTISARSYGVGAEFTRIVQANPTITDPNQIFVGESLIIPDGSVPAPAPAPAPAAAPKPVTTAVQVPAKAPTSAAPVRRTVAAAAAPAVVSGGGLGGVWACIRQHESGGNYATNTGNGYYGAYQFSLSTWRAMGGSGLPSSAPPAVQDALAQKLQARSGFGQWPMTSRMCGAR
jgi:LysM repeat protein